MATKRKDATSQNKRRPPALKTQGSRLRVRRSPCSAAVTDHPRKGTVKLQEDQSQKQQIQKNAVKKQALGSRRSARLRNEPPVSHAPHPPYLQAHPIPPISILKPNRAKRKFSQDDEPEGSHPSKQPRRLPPKYELSEKNLRLLEEMDAAVNNTRRKRSLSRRSASIASDATQDTTQDTNRSQRSSGTAAFYRFTHLATAQVYIHVDPPKDTQDAINAIIKAEPAKERRDRLKHISKAFHDGCTEAARAAVGEDDFVRHFYTALKAMKPNNLCLREKADWHEDLKPKIRRSHINLDFLTDLNFISSDQNQKGDTSSPPPPKRQQQSIGRVYISPNSSVANALDPTSTKGPVESSVMPPPAQLSLLDKEGDQSPIKTPRPDISIGPYFTTLISALSSQNLNSTEARLFLTQLQNQMVLREPGGPKEPALISVPALRASDLVFPFAVVEGKAYSTGKQVFEAQNQAAVSGACGLKMQLCLDELVKRAISTPSKDKVPIGLKSQSTPSENQPALFFSICTEGPIHELWVHWTNVEDGVRKFNMKLLKLCHGVLLEDVENFIIAVDNMLHWGTGQFVESIGERLRKVARKAA